MIIADRPIQRPSDAKLLIVDRCRGISHAVRSELADYLAPGDLLVANDAATLPASLFGRHERTGVRIEVRLAAGESLAPEAVARFRAIVFGDGDFRIPTEQRAHPPALAPGDRLSLGPLAATIEQLCGHPRLVQLRFAGSAKEIWAGLAEHGRPIQYSHMRQSLQLWDVWTAIAGPPVAFEPPSAGFILNWRMLAALRKRGVAFATITHAAGISSTGDLELDRRLPFDEPYRIPRSTAEAISRVRTSHGRILAVGTTVVRALEHAAEGDGRVRPGEGIARQRLGAGSRLRVVDAVVSGTHEPGTSHYELLRAFTDEHTLRTADRELEAHRYRTHEFGDSVLIESTLQQCRSALHSCHSAVTGLLRRGRINDDARIFSHGQHHEFLHL